jgi:L-cysteine S-thiosulfotransferase
VPNCTRATISLLAFLLAGSAGSKLACAESEWLGKAFPEKASAPEKAPRPPAPAANKPSVAAAKQQQREEAVAAAAAVQKDRERARRVAEREAEREAQAEAQRRSKAQALVEAKRKAAIAADAATAKREDEARTAKIRDVASRAAESAATPTSIDANPSFAAIDQPRMGLGVPMPPDTKIDATPRAAAEIQVPAPPAAPPREIAALPKRTEPVNRSSNAPVVAATVVLAPALPPPALAPSLAVPPDIAVPAVHVSPPAPTSARETPAITPEAPSAARAASIARGQRLWQLRRGPRHASLEGCDLGLGPGRVVGTFAHLPRYFADANRVMDLETRLVWCAQTQQEIAPASLLDARSIDGVMASELEDVASFVASLSISWRLSPPTLHEKERQAQTIGKALYARRQGPLDFSCATCHGSPDAMPSATRVRAIKRWQNRPLPQIGVPSEAQTTIPGWPAWRASLGGMRTLQGRLGSCFAHMGVEAPAAGSDAMVALVAYLSKLGENGEVVASGHKP